MNTYKVWATRALLLDVLALSCLGLLARSWSGTFVAALLVWLIADLLSIKFRPVMTIMSLLRLGNIVGGLSFVSDRLVYLLPVTLMGAALAFGGIALRSGFKGVIASTPRCPRCSARVRVGASRCRACGAENLL